MADNTLNVLMPSVNNLTVRSSSAPPGSTSRRSTCGARRRPRVPAKDPAHLTPLLEEAGLPRGSLWESCAIMQYLCNKHGLDQFYPTDPGERAMVDSAMFYLIGTLYPLLARATYPKLGFPQYPGEAATSEPTTRSRRRPSRTPRRRSPSRSTSTARSSSRARRSSAATTPSIADIRLAASLEFLTRSTTLPGLGEGVHGARWSRRSATPTPSRRATCAASSRR